MKIQTFEFGVWDWVAYETVCLKCWMLKCIAISNVVLLAFQFWYSGHIMNFIWIRYWTMDHNSPFTKCIANYPKVNRIKWDLFENIFNNQTINLLISFSFVNLVSFTIQYSSNVRFLSRANPINRLPEWLPKFKLHPIHQGKWMSPIFSTQRSLFNKTEKEKTAI